MSGILIVEDNATLAKNMATYLRSHGYGVHTASEARQALVKVDAFSPDVVLVDYSLPGMDGLELIRRMLPGHPRLKAVMITAHGSVQVAVEAMKSGAIDFLSKPIALSEVKQSIERAMKPIELVRRPAACAGHPGEALDRMIGTSPPIVQLKDTVRRMLDAERHLGERDAPAAVLVSGETGTGKELVARAVHEEGRRAAGPFVELNCAALPAALVESELFGFERGAFTDARECKPGLAELAQGGTLFLDEVGELEPGVQSKLLKLIENRTFRRLGAMREQACSARIIAATNQDLEHLVACGKFRADLFFRLRIVHLRVPALRERGEDILLLARHFLQQHAARYGKPGLHFSRECEAALAAYAWPGNVRELRNALERAVLLAQGGCVGFGQLELLDVHAGARPAPPVAPAALDVLPDGGVVLEEFEQGLLRQALARTHWNVTRAARLLGVSRDTLRYRIGKFALKPPIRPE